MNYAYTMPEEKEAGRTVYHRIEMGGGEEPRAPKEERPPEPVVTPRDVGRVSLMRTLAPLLVGFVLLIGLVYGLGSLSDRRVSSISQRSFIRERRLNVTLSRLYQLRIALNNLDHEARARDRTTPGVALRPPGDLRLNNARHEVVDILPLYDELPIARTEKGQALRRDIDAFVEVTKDATAYNLTGFNASRGIEQQLNTLFEEANGERQKITDEGAAALEDARREINFLKWLAVLTGLVVAAATTLEVLRRFRQLRRSLEEVRRERQFSSQMLEGMVSAIAAADARGRLRSANASFFEIFPEARLGEPLGEAVKSPEAAKLIAAATSAPGAEPSTYRGRWRLAPAAGRDRERSFDIYSAPLEIDGEPGQILTLVDVTEAAENERELRRQESLAAVGQAAAQVAHEIKNPLGSIRLGVAMLRDMSRERDAINTIDLVERGIEHLSKLTSDVTQFSRRRELSLSDVELHELLGESLELVADQIGQKGTPVEKNFYGGPIRARWDADQLRQVFVNLLANAADASPPRSPITVSTERADGVEGAEGVRGRRTDFARVHVTDRGAGVDEATSQRIFEPFFTTKRRGTGLGLSIAKQIVDQHGGRITVTSRPGEGTRFTVDLPILPDGAEV